MYIVLETRGEDIAVFHNESQIGRYCFFHYTYLLVIDVQSRINLAN